MRSHILLGCACCSLLLWLAGCARPNPRDSLAGVQAPAGSPRLLAIYQPWFGGPGHIDVGYSSHDVETLRRQIARAQELNITGFVVDWYGPRHEFNDKTLSLLMQQAAAENNFAVAVQYDEPVDRPGGSTDAALSDLRYLYDRYLGPRAPAWNSAYLHYRGRPVIFIFPKGAGTDWNRVREYTQSWTDPPLLFYKDPNPRYNNAFDGYYPWIHPGKGGWARDGSHWGEDYLEHFYKSMIDRYPNKIAVGAVWPGFDDSRASWGRNRRMAYRCGKTFENTMRVFRRYYGPENSPPYLLVETWNDYEEGTDIERSISHCRGGSGAAIDTARAGGR